MREVDHRVSVLVDLMKDVVPEELDDVAVARLGPPRLARKSNINILARKEGLTGRNILRSLVDEAEFAQEAHETGVL
jgi:hypothetical protein